MTLTEFKIWMEGFSEGKDFETEGVTADQWKKINAKFTQLEETKQTITYRAREQDTPVKPKVDAFAAIKADAGFI